MMTLMVLCQGTNDCTIFIFVKWFLNLLRLDLYKLKGLLVNDHLLKLQLSKMLDVVYLIL